MSLQNRHFTPRLLIILNRFVIGGQAVDTLPLAYFLQKDFEILILYGEKEKDEIEPTFLLEKYPGLQLQKVQYLKRAVNPFVDIAAFCQLFTAILKFKPHIVHTHGAKSGILGRSAAFLAGVPVIIHTFHGHLFHSYFSKSVTRLVILIERFLAKFTTGFIALSNSQYSDLVERFKIATASKLKIIPLGFINDDLQAKNLLRIDFRKKYNLKDDDVAIGIVGRIVPVKNHFFFADVANKILKEHAVQNTAFFIIGDGDLKMELEQYFEKAHVPYSEKEISDENRVVFTSWLTNIPEVMSGLDIVVLTSLNEGTPLSLIEAQAYGKPVVATNVGGVSDTLIKNVTGFCIEKNDLNEFVSKVFLLVNDAAKRIEMGEAGAKFINQKFSKQKEIDMTKDFYFSLLTLRNFRSS